MADRTAWLAEFCSAAAILVVAVNAVVVVVYVSEAGVIVAVTEVVPVVTGEVVAVC